MCFGIGNATYFSHLQVEENTKSPLGAVAILQELLRSVLYQKNVICDRSLKVKGGGVRGSYSNWGGRNNYNKGSFQSNRGGRNPVGRGFGRNTSNLRPQCELCNKTGHAAIDWWKCITTNSKDLHR
ncbi:hypothetical protein VNO78_10252 [Psophocarpus tetragonolobus]|uniref:Uncharacterized protein n=1 Tax=Psophocarpus tetragonolobus TaxID=3891 RepID=A0AAN9SKZ6_PSOTE